jgi:hypothetical protein
MGDPIAVLITRRAFLTLLAAVPLARPRKPPRRGFGAGGFGLTPFGS